MYFYMRMHDRASFTVPQITAVVFIIIYKFPVGLAVFTLRYCGADGVSYQFIYVSPSERDGYNMKGKLITIITIPHILPAIIDLLSPSNSTVCVVQNDRAVIVTPKKRNIAPKKNNES